MKKDGLTLKPLDKKLATAIEAMDCGRGKEFHDVFDEFLDLSLGLMANNPNPHQVEVLTRMRDDVEYKDAFVNDKECLMYVKQKVEEEGGAQ